ncbi:MAG: DUF2384 domain-containing protein [Syntrophomonadaceae bacterium]|nr:DUF2384 domain-containing protein [Syntrophomonadaceae bacterium]
MAKKLKIGRNDPCPCGSGKKFKNCCGRWGEITSIYEDPFSHYNQLATSAKVKLERYFVTEAKKYRQSIKSRFTRFAVKKTIPEPHESIFSDWLWFDFRDEQGMSMGERYLAENAAYMEEAVLECTQAFNRSYLSVYKLKGAIGTTLKIQDILLGTEHQVIIKEPLLIEEEDPEMIMLGRIISMPAAKLFSGMVLMLENNLLQEDFIHEHFKYWKELRDQDIPYLLKHHGEIIYGIFDHAAQKMLLNLNDIRIWVLQPEERDLLLQQLEQSSEYTLHHQTSGYYWFKAKEEVAGYSRLIIRDKLLLSAADVLEEVYRHANFVDTILPDHPVQVINSLLLSAPPTPEYAELWFLVLKDRECENWLHTPHGDFNGQTPAELLQQEGGAEKIIDRLNSYLDTTVMEAEKEVLEYIKLRCLKG